MAFLGTIVDLFAPVFLMASPITSYADQIYSIHKNKSSAGFSLDIPLIMLVASILKLFYWFGAYYSTTLLFQAILMICVQLVLLKVALEHRPVLGGKNGLGHNPFTHVTPEGTLLDSRPYNFWQWRSTRP
ncbi:putative pq loop repeat protein [Phaeomoniella chlamydospora]|uniref:Putative pq loop repeat protein n=1 Tax=Phaeomoniella chlamydospora TaxID=158046 RepID=A0A0G2DYF6_PHACM|nr:putative pq loop repeat protein [Phaeomoniella chlamydospora]